MKFSLTPRLTKQIRKIKQTNPQLQQKIQKQLLLFNQDHRHISLQNHKLRGKLNDVWSISIESNLRILYYVRENEAVFFLLGNHDEVYGKS